MDKISKEQRSELMSHIRSKDTSPELSIRRLLHHNGYRFGLHATALPGTPDLVLRKYGVLIFVDGCFWHGHENCPIYKPPQSRKKFWNAKIERNKRRDKMTDRKLSASGWRVLHIWECAIRSKGRLSEDILLKKIETFLHCEGKIKNIRGKIK